MKKRIVSIITALVLCLSLLPAGAFAAEADQADEELDERGTARYEGTAAALDTLAEIPMANTYGWDATTKVYTVIGQDGYPTNSPITLAAGATLDLRQADNYSSTASYSQTYLFKALGDLTILGDGNSINFSEKSIVQMPQGNHTLTLKDFYWDESVHISGAYYYLLQKNSTITVRYEGKSAFPMMQVASDNANLIFEPKNTNESIRIVGINYGVKSSTTQETIYYSGSVEFNGGSVTIDSYISAEKITIKNSCNLTGEGDDFSGIYCLNDDGTIVIQDSTVDLTCNGRYNGGQDYPALGGNISPQYATGFADDSNRWYYRLYQDPDAIQSKVEITDSTVTVSINKDNIPYGGIGCVKDIVINGSDVTVSSLGTSQYNHGTAGIGVVFQNIRIENSTVVSDASNGAGIGTGHAGFYRDSVTDEQLSAIKGTITISNSTVEASSREGAGIGSTPVFNSSFYVPQPVDVTISGDSTVTTRSVNGAGIGGGQKTPVINDPDAVIINPGIGGGWETGGSSGGDLETFSLRSLLANDTPIGDSGVPAAVQKYVWSDGQTLHVTSTDDGTPTILAESGVCAISSETVTTAVTIVQNTVETAPSQTVPILVGDVKLGDLRDDFKSIARTAPAVSNSKMNWDAITPGTYSMYYGDGNDPDPLININEAAGTLYQAGPYQIVSGQINRFWTIPQQKLGGSAQVATGSTTGTTVSTSTKDTTLYAKITSLTPSDVSGRIPEKQKTLSYQWYQDGQPITDATSSSYLPTEAGLYWYVVTGSDRYRGSVTSAVVTVTADPTVLPAAPTMDSSDKTSITLISVEGNEYGILKDDGTIHWQESTEFKDLTPNTSYNFFQRLKATDTTAAGPISRSATFATKGDKPSESEISYDYEKETIRFNTDIAVFTNSACSSTKKLSTNDVITSYIGKTLYARYADVSSTGDDVVLAFTVPARPAAPVLYSQDIQAATDSITITGTPGVAYNYAKAGGTPDEKTAVDCGDDGIVTFTNLTADTEYTIYSRWPASNTKQRFHSDTATISGKTLATEPTSTKIYVPVGATGERTYNLTEVLNGKTIKSVSDSLRASVSEDGSSVTITPTGDETGTVTLTATLSGGSSYTIEVVFQTDVVKEGTNILWLWRSANEDLENGARSLLQTNESLVTGATRRLTAVYASGSSASKTVPNPGTADKVLLPYWEDTGATDDWLLVYQDGDKVERVTSLTLTADGIQLTNANPGIYGLYTVTPATQKNFKFDITEKTVTYGDEDFTVIATGAADGSTVTYSSSDTNVATVDENTGKVTIVGVGTTTITATASAVGSDWKETKVQYTLTVTDKQQVSGGGSGSSTYTVTVGDASHGTVKADRTRASSGTTVTLTVTPSTGYMLSSLTVTDAKGNELTLTAQGGGKYTFKMPSSKVTVEAVFTAVETGHNCPSLDFTDLDVDAWYHEAVDFVLENGLMSGYGSGIFGPNDTLSRAMLATILYRLEGEPAVDGSKFTDVKSGMYYTEAVAWASANGIVTGYGDGTFLPDKAITRQEMAAMLYRYTQGAGYDVTNMRDLGNYPDAGKVSAYAVEALQWATGAGLITDMGDGTLNPQGSATRAQVATILMRFLAL